MIDELSRSLGCSIISIRRLLKRAGYFRSYTHNGKWYTLSSIPVFNKNGIWLYGDIGFSKQGTLTKTIIYHVNKSSAGLSARDLAELLHHPCHAVLTIMYKAKQIDRVKPTSEYTYLSRDESVNRLQHNHLKGRMVEQTAQPLNTQAAVFVLVEFIKNPGLSFEQMARGLRDSQQITVMPSDITRFFREHGLKKTVNIEDLKY
ncbi:MAG: hypothetical protein U9N73_06045 [Candidatus Auribacterota bacterium]|nr:hypothetical protein [Candidatus Auribacterota bacterium]